MHCIDQKPVHGAGLVWTHIPHGAEDFTGDRPLVERDAAAQTAVGHLLSRFFENSSSSLALRLIESERPSDDELVRLKALIEQYEEGAP